MLTKKYYEIIAATFAATRPDATERNFLDRRECWVRVASRIADECARDNVKFDRARFLKACGVAS